MPAHSMQLTDPARWVAPAVPAAWVEEIRRSMPAYDPQMTPTRSMGTVAELFRTSPGAVRSARPSTSFAATARLADWITADHSLESPLGEGSPLARLYDVDATVLLLGVSFDVCTMLHLAEHRAWPDRSTVSEGAPMMVDGVRRWITYAVPPLCDSENFESFGRHLIEIDVAKRFRVGIGTGLIMSSRQIVDLAVQDWRGRAPFSD